MLIIDERLEWRDVDDAERLRRVLSERTTDRKECGRNASVFPDAVADEIRTSRPFRIGGIARSWTSRSSFHC